MRQPSRPGQKRACTALLVLALAVTAAAGKASAQTAGTEAVDRARSALPESARSTIDTYLRTDCELGEQGKALEPVLALGAAGRPYLEAVARAGPPAEERAVLARSVDETWAARMKLLDGARGKDLGPEALAQLRGLSESDYRADQEAALDAKYRERAVLALRALDGSGGATSPAAAAAPAAGAPGTAGPAPAPAAAPAVASPPAPR